MQERYEPGCPCRRLIGGVWTEDAVSLAEECRLSVFVDGQPFSTLFCTPAEPAELIYGHLLTEKKITCRKQVQTLTLDESGLPDALTASVTLSVIARSAATWQSVPPSVIARSEATWQSVPFVQTAAPNDPPRTVWTPEQLQILFDHVVRDALSTRGGHSTHSCTLMLDGEILCTREDIGRHNALDRAAGWALLHDVPLPRCLAFFSGRVSTEAVTKAAAAGLTVLCAKALPTAQAVRLAKQLGLTLLHLSGGRGLMRFTP